MSNKFIPAAIVAILVASPMAVLAKTQGDYDNAIADYTEAIRLEPKHAKAYYSRGRAYGQKDDYVNALTMSVTLKDGTTLEVVSQALLNELTPGARVDLHFRDLDGSMAVTEVHIDG